MVLASDDVEFFANRVADNQSANAMIVSFAATGKPANDVGYEPYPQRISIHDNEFSGGGDKPDGQNMKPLRLGPLGERGTIPDVLWDGVMPRDVVAAGMQICVHDNGDADFANINLRGELTSLSTDLAPHRCTLAALSEVTWPKLGSASAASE
jgi:hypothetical protein